MKLISEIREKANTFLSQELRRRQIEGLVPSHGAILANLYQHDGVPMAELANRIRRDKSTVTTLVDKLAALEYVVKTKDPLDQRITRIYLTDRGKVLQPEFEEISRQLLTKIYRGFSELEQEMLVRLLEQVLQNF